MLSCPLGEGTGLCTPLDDLFNHRTDSLHCNLLWSCKLRAFVTRCTCSRQDVAEIGFDLNVNSWFFEPRHRLSLSDFGQLSDNTINVSVKSFAQARH